MNARGPGTNADLLRGELMRTIEAEIIPRLMLAHSGPAREAAPHAAPRRCPGFADVSALAAMVVERELPAVLDFLAAFAAAGAPLESLMLDLVSPAALLLGDLWASGSHSFDEVTAGLAMLEQVVHALERDDGAAFAP